MSRTPQLCIIALVCLGTVVRSAAGRERCPHIEIRGVYGGIPDELLQQGKTLADCGINAIWIGSGGLTAERVDLLRQQGARVFAEFNTMHVAGYLKDHPDAAPISSDGIVRGPTRISKVRCARSWPST